MEVTEVVGTFQCPACWQKYDRPAVPVESIRVHLMRHGLKRTVAWIDKHTTKTEGTT